MSEIDFQALNHSAGIDTALVLDDPDSIGWDACFDVIVVGLGGAGACAAVEAGSLEWVVRTMRVQSSSRFRDT